CVMNSAANLKDVHIVQGGKYYGTSTAHCGPVPVALLGDTTPRAKEPTFYFDQEDFVRTYGQGKKWRISKSRPHAFCDTHADYPRSIGLIIAVLAVLKRELGEPFDFPGTAMAYNARTEFTETGLLARGISWMAQEPRCANQSFNLV